MMGIEESVTYEAITVEHLIPKNETHKIEGQCECRPRQIGTTVNHYPLAKRLRERGEKE